MPAATTGQRKKNVKKIKKFKKRKTGICATALAPLLRQACGSG
jgi:hypothetical protein